MHKLFNARAVILLSSDILKFDNSRSWARSKEVFYSVKVLPPDTNPQPQATNQMEEISDTEEFFDCDSDSDEGGLRMNNVQRTTVSKGS